MCLARGLKEGHKPCCVLCVFRGIMGLTGKRAGQHWVPPVPLYSLAMFPLVTSHPIPLQLNMKGMLYSECTEAKLMRFSLSLGQDLETRKKMEK